MKLLGKELSALTVSWCVFCLFNLGKLLCCENLSTDAGNTSKEEDANSWVCKAEVEGCKAAPGPKRGVSVALSKAPSHQRGEPHGGDFSPNDNPFSEE